MIRRVAFVGAAKAFFSDVKDNLLEFYPEMRWLEFDNGFEIINYCLNNKDLPEIVFAETFLFKIDGITLTDYLSTYHPDIRVLCVIDELDDNVISTVSEVGAVGLMDKSDAGMLFQIAHSNGDTCRIVKTTWNNIATIHTVGYKDLFHYRNTIFEKHGITKRESLFLLLNATGIEYCEIAALMFISRKTVDNLFNSVAKKFGVQNRHNLTLFCIKMRLANFSIVKKTTTRNIAYH